jgi:hypothetical protein
LTARYTFLIRKLAVSKDLRSSRRPKAAKVPQKQDFAATAEDSMKLAKTKGSKHTQKSRFCCHRHRPHETHQEQRQQTRLGSRIFAASAADPMKPTKTKGSKRASGARICCHRHRPDMI